MQLNLLNIEGFYKYNFKILSDKTLIKFNSLSTNFYPQYIEEGKLYIINYSNLFELEDASKASGYICLNNMENQKPEQSFEFPVLLIKGTIELKQIFDIVLEKIFDMRRYDEGKSLLLDALEHNDGIHHILNIAAEIMNNPFYFIDISFRVVAWSTNINIENADWNEIISNGFIDERKIKNLIKKDETILDIISTTPKLLKIFDSNYEAINCNIYIGDNRIGFFGLCNYVHPFNSNDIEFVDYVKKIVVAQFNKSGFYNYTKSSTYEYFFVDLLKSPLSTDVIEFRKKLLNIKLGENLLVLLISNKIENFCTNAAVVLVQKELINIIKYSYSFIFECKIVFIIDMKENKWIDNHLLEKIIAILQDKNLIGAFSNPFSDISLLKNYYNQANSTIQIALFRKENECLYYYKDHIVDNMLMICVQHESPLSFNHPVINLLKEYDKFAGTQYLISLKTYIDCFGNMSEAAKLLDIHYNTMKYRINMIESIANISLKDPDTYTNIYVSFRIYKGFDKIGLEYK